MATCSKCHRTWRTTPGEESDHDCPACGPLPPDEPDESPYYAWDACYERTKAQFHDVLYWLGGWAWLTDNYDPATELLIERNRLLDELAELAHAERRLRMTNDQSHTDTRT